MEKWAAVDWVAGYRGALEVSNQGRVRRNAYSYVTTGRWGTRHTASKPDKILSSYVETSGYPSIAVQINGRRKKFSIHRLVGRAFVPGFVPGLTVNHINGIKTDNRAENLEWVTLSKNTQHQWATGLVDLRADAHPNKKLTSGQVRIVRRLLTLGATAGELAILTCVSASTIYLIAKGRRWSSIS